MRLRRFASSRKPILDDLEGVRRLGMDARVPLAGKKLPDLIGAEIVRDGARER